jgi:hypothetical protein
MFSKIYGKGALALSKTQDQLKRECHARFLIVVFSNCSTPAEMAENQGNCFEPPPDLLENVKKSDKNKAF